MSSKSLDMTTTPCEQCKQVLTENEAMIACDNCDRWFHLRCVGLTTVPRKWFCSDASCQVVCQEKLKKNRDKKNPTAPPHPTVAEKLKAMEAERKSKEEEMEAEWFIKQKEMEINNALQEKRRRLERDFREKQLTAAREFREKEMEEQRILFETELREKQEHFEQMKAMEIEHREKISELEKRMGKVDVKEKPKKNKKIPNAGSQDVRPGTSKHSPTEQKPGKLTKENLDRLGTTNGSDEEEEEVESSDNDSDSSEEEILVEGDDDKRSHISSQHGQGHQRVGPSKAQLSARNGLTRKLPTFTGKPEEWPLLFGVYQASNEACGYSDVENSARVSSWTTSPSQIGP